MGNRSSGFWKSHFGWRRSPRCLLKVLGVGWGAYCLFERCDSPSVLSDVLIKTLTAPPPKALPYTEIVCWEKEIADEK